MFLEYRNILNLLKHISDTILYKNDGGYEPLSPEKNYAKVEITMIPSIFPIY